MRTVTPAPIRFWAKVDKTDTCWLWTASTDAYGYGAFGLTRSKMVKAHRFAYEQVKGPIPPGLTIDHLCRVRHCVNPDHLEAVTNRANVLRGMAPPAICARKERCDLGHEFTLRKDGARFCRQCTNARARQRAAEKRQMQACA